MKMRNLVLTLGILTASIGISQGPLYDKIIVNMPYPMTVNETVLPAGDYEIRQHQSAAGGSRILHFFSDGGMKLETTAMAIPALDNKTPEETTLVLEHIGPDYYLNKVWVQGKNYGYEFPIPESVRLREKERTSVTARYETAPAVAKSETTTTTTLERETTRTETAQTTTPPPVVEVQPAPVVEVQPAPAPPVEVAQNRPFAETAPVEPAPAARIESADRGTRTMPATAGNWLNLLLGGGLLTGSGLALRRFRA